MKYLLAFERNKNDFVPIDFSLLGLRKVNNLSDIDEVTSSMSEKEFLKLAYDANVFGDEIKSNLALIYFENGKMRKCKFGAVFKDTKMMNYLEMQDYIISNLKDKDKMNKIWNAFHSKKNSVAFSSFLEGIKNGVFTRLGECDYSELRSLSLFLVSL